MSFKYAKFIFAFTVSLGFVVGCSQEKSNSPVKSRIQNNQFIDIATLLKSQNYSSDQVLKAEKSMRVSVTKSVKEALLNQYSLVDLKEKRILTQNGESFNTLEHLDACVKIEEQTDDISDLHFIDRLKKCIAGFQDTHLKIHARIAAPTVSTGILIRKFDNKYYISNRQSELLQYLQDVNKDSDINALTAIGNEIISIDGQSPEELSKHYKLFTSGSSDSFRNIRADQSIFLRDFDYPTKNYVDIVVKSPLKTYHYKLPWWASENTKSRADAQQYFQRINIPISPKVLVQNEQNNDSLYPISTVYEGYSETKPIEKSNAYSALAEFKTDSGRLAARMGVISAQKQNFCYLELLTFSSANLIPLNSAEQTQSYMSTIKDFIQFCKNKDFDLVMDLRNNTGGYGNYPYEILSLIAKSDTQLGGKVIAFRSNQISERLVSSLVEHPEYNTGDFSDVDFRMQEELTRTLNTNQRMTGMLPVHSAITPNEEIGGFNKKVIGLVTPNCISACDGMSALLKRSGRGVLLGSHSNGTGAGFVGTSAVDSIFQDSYLEVWMKIPNYQFGYSTHPFESLDSFDFDSNADEYFTENMPTVADVIVKTEFEDIMGSQNTWLNAVVRELQKN